MLLTKSYLKKLILETIEEIYIKGIGGEEDKFVDKQGNVFATAPKITNIPKIKYKTSNDEFFEAFKPLIAFSQTRDNQELFISLKELIKFFIARKNSSAKKTAGEFNVEYQDTGAKFNEDKVQAILDSLQEENTQNSDQVLNRLSTIPAAKEYIKYIPDPDAVKPYKTASMAPIREKITLKYR